MRALKKLRKRRIHKHKKSFITVKGYYYSNTPIVISYTIDTTKIPDNYYITVGGDTIYDYNITNPSTGDTTTINNYITNNYTFITNPDNPDIGTSGDTVNNYYDGATIIKEL